MRSPRIPRRREPTDARVTAAQKKKAKQIIQSYIAKYYDQATPERQKEILGNAAILQTSLDKQWLALYVATLFDVTSEVEKLDDSLRTLRSAEEILTERMLEFANNRPHVQAVKAARAKLANDPKQAAKAKAFKLWQQWQTGVERHRSGAAFARHVVKVLPTLESTSVVERWVTRWRRDAKFKK